MEKMSRGLHHIGLQTTMKPQKHRGGGAERFETKAWVYEFLLKL